jgi:hypothetical protein
VDLLIILLLVFLVLGGGLGYGYWGHRRGYAPELSWSPLVGIILILVLLKILRVI